VQSSKGQCSLDLAFKMWVTSTVYGVLLWLPKQINAYINEIKIEILQKFLEKKMKSSSSMLIPYLGMLVKPTYSAWFLLF
jgi:hypothetical protein